MQVIRIEPGSRAFEEIARAFFDDAGYRALSISPDEGGVKVKIGEGMWTYILDTEYKGD
jgi:hypothetical protein